MPLIRLFLFFFFFKQKTAYDIRLSLVGSEMCIRDSAIRPRGWWPRTAGGADRLRRRRACTAGGGGRRGVSDSLSESISEILSQERFAVGGRSSVAAITLGPPRREARPGRASRHSVRTSRRVRGRGRAARSRRTTARQGSGCRTRRTGRPVSYTHLRAH